MEALISMIGMNFIEDYGLLNEEQLNQAKASLQALFLQSSGEETMLHKLIDILRSKKVLNQTFNDMTIILSSIAKSADTIEKKIAQLGHALHNLSISAEENEAFVGQFLHFSYEFAKKVREFERQMLNYRTTKETEARYANMYRIAKEARERLRKRFSGDLASKADSGVASEIKQRVIESFDYEQTEVNYRYARRQAQTNQQEIKLLLNNFKKMCQQAMNPQMRDNIDLLPQFQDQKYEDVYTLFSQALQRFTRLKTIQPAVVELFRLYQHSFGMFNLDFEKFNRAVEPILNDTDAYFMAKEEDEDIREKRDKLSKIEGLIFFLEHAAELLGDGVNYTYTKFSSRISDVIIQPRSQWGHIGEDLLRMKVIAEAEYSTRLI